MFKLEKIHNRDSYINLNKLGGEIGISKLLKISINVIMNSFVF